MRKKLFLLNIIVVLGLILVSAKSQALIVSNSFPLRVKGLVAASPPSSTGDSGFKASATSVTDNSSADTQEAEGININKVISFDGAFRYNEELYFIVTVPDANYPGTSAQIVIDKDQKKVDVPIPKSYIMQ